MLAAVNSFMAGTAMWQIYRKNVLPFNIFILFFILLFLSYESIK